MTIKNIALVVVSIVLLSACSKDKKIEKVVYKNDGEWKIKSVSWNQIIQTQNGQSITNGTSTDIGTFTFNENGSGSYYFTIDTNIYQQSFNWSVSDESISVTKVSQTFDFSGNIKQIAVAFSGTQNSKTELTIEGSETIQGYTGEVTQRVFTGTFLLGK